MKVAGPVVEAGGRSETAAKKDTPARAAPPGEGFAVPSGVLSRMEPIVGGDLSDVRLHTDSAAALRATSHGALAVAEGRHIAFAPGIYRPGTIAGDAVLAHELAHTRQQSGGGVAAVGGEGALEREADQAGYVAVLSLLDPSLSSRIARPDVSAGRGLRLQRCAPDISALPTREEYEKRGELAPLSSEGIPWDAASLTKGGWTLTTAGQAPIVREQVMGLAAAKSAPAELFSDSELLLRLDILDVNQKQIDALVADLAGGSRQPNIVGLPPWSAADQDIALARNRLTPGDLGMPMSPAINAGPDPAQRLPESRAELARAIVVAEPLQWHIIQTLQDLHSTREGEAAADAQLKGYDVAGALAVIDTVRSAYRTAADLVLTPSAATAVAAADQQQTGLQRTLSTIRLGYFQSRTSEYGGVASSIRMIHEWAAKLQGDLDGLAQQAALVQAARESGTMNGLVLESEFARRAQLVEASIEALGEWDKAVRVYEMLAGGGALWGYGNVQVIAKRLAEMRLAAYAGDLPYLVLLLRDHRADPALAKYYASIPSIIEWSHVVIGLAITLIAAVATAGVGLAVGVVAETVAGAAGAFATTMGAGATTAAYVVIGTEFLINLGGEAFAFTFFSRQLSSLVPGMAPTGSFWGEFAWNLGLFTIMKGAGAAAKALVNALALSRFASKLAVTVGLQFAALEAFGYVRFAYENERPMSLLEFGKMSAQNAIMLGVTMVAMGPMQPLVERAQKAMPTTSLGRLARTYRTEAAAIAARRAALERATEEQMAAKPNPAPDETQEVTKQLADEGESLNGQLQALVDTIAADPLVKAENLPTEVADALGEARTTSLPDLMVGLEQAVELRPTGRETVWTFEADKGRQLIAYLEEGQYPITGEAKPWAGHEVIEAVVPGKGEVTFVERDPARPTSPAQAAAVPPVLEAVTAKSATARAGLDWARNQTVAPALLGRLAQAAEATPAPVRSLLELAGRVSRARGGPNPDALAAGGDIAAEELSAARAGEQTLAAVVETALQDPLAATGLRRLSNKYPPRFPKALAGILASATPENVPKFLQAMATAELGSQQEAYQALARSPAACELAVKYGGDLLLKIVNLQAGGLPGERILYSGVDVDRALQALDAVAKDPKALADLRRKIMGLGEEATPTDLDPLVGPRPRPVVTIEPKFKDPTWEQALEKADEYSAGHPQPGGGALSPEIRELRATLFQLVLRARGGEFRDFTPAERHALQQAFNDQAQRAGMLKGWISSVRGNLNEALARGTATPSVRTVWHDRGVVTRGKAPKGSTIPDEAFPPVTQKEIDDGSVTRTARLWYEDKSYALGGRVDANGIPAGARAAANKHAAEAALDLTNLPLGSTIALRYSENPAPAIKRAMADRLYAVPGVDQVIFQGEIIPRRP